MITALEAFNAVADQYQCDELAIEEFVQLSDNIGGSADVIAAGDTHVLVVDWKFGYNEVSAHKSWQAATYALSSMYTDTVADMFRERQVVAVIIQPKVSPEPSVYEFSPEELSAMMGEMLLAVAEAENDKPSPMRVPGASSARRPPSARPNACKRRRRLTCPKTSA